jgi:glycosyltransferase involved in cell wall biosynthesis
MSIQNISVIIHTKNSAATLSDAIGSVNAWAAEVLVIDMQSSDRTVELARGMHAKVMMVQDYGYVEPARNEAIAKARGPWVLILDADEIIPATLADALQKLSFRTEIQAYYLPRKNMIFGKWARTGWWPDYIPRFFQKGSVEWPATLHSVPIITGAAHYLEAKEEYAIIHNNYPTVEDFITRLNRYTSIAAQAGTEDRLPMLRAGYEEFVRRYYEDAGYQDGTYGLSLSLLQMFYQTVVAIKQWEKVGLPEDGQDLALEDELDRMYQYLCYWIADMHIHTSRSPLAKLYWRVRRKLKV